MRDEDEAVRRANDDGYNLTASVWTTDRSKARRIASRVRSGAVTINCHVEAAGAPWAPWGGIGESGFGRLNGVYGVREFTVPTHIATNLLPHAKRIFWYPYGEATEEALRSFTETLAARSGAAKLGAARRFAGSCVQALKEKL